MALVDVSEVLTDPDLMDRLSVLRGTQTVNQAGIATTVRQRISFAGVVTSDLGRILDRIAEGERVHGTITVHTRFRLTDGKSPQSVADVVQWQQREWTVTHVQDYSNFGRGFIAATCDLFPFNG